MGAQMNLWKLRRGEAPKEGASHWPKMPKLRPAPNGGSECHQTEGLPELAAK